MSFPLGLPELFLIVLGLAVFALWLWALVDCVLHEPPTIDKLVWTLVILWLNVFGATAYMLLRRPRRGQGAAVAARA